MPSTKCKTTEGTNSGGRDKRESESERTLLGWSTRVRNGTLCE